MTCRIERLINGRGSVVLRVSGRIEAEHVDTLNDMLGLESGTVALDLEEVLIVARDALGPLASLEKNGVELRNCPAYVREWISKERAGTAKPTDLPPGATDEIEDV